MNYLTLDLDNGDLVLSDNSEWKSLNTWLDGGTLYSDYYDASNCGDFWVASSHWISIDSESTYLTFTIEYEFIDATATDSCLCQIKFDGFEDGGVAVTADSSGLNISTDASKHINCDYSNANIKIDITVNLLTKEITTYIHKDNEPLAKKVNVSNYSFTEFVIQAGSRGDIVYKLPTTTKLLNLSVSDVAVSYSNFPETIDYIDKLGLVRIWANTKSYIASQLLGKSNTGHTHSKSDVTDLLNSNFVPSTNGSYNLGSSSYQWNNTYTKKLYLNGTEFGLDTANAWTAQNSFNSDLNLNYASTDVDDIVNSVAGSATLDNFVHMTGNETVNGIKSFPDGVIANVTGSATSATNDGSGNVISTTYGKLGAVNTWTNENIFQRQGRACSFENPVAESGSTTEANTFIAWLDKAGNQIGYINRSTSSGGNDSMRFCLVSKRDANGNPSTSGTERACGLDFVLDSSSTYSITPIASEITDLGAYSVPWKSVYAQHYYHITSSSSYSIYRDTVQQIGVAPSETHQAVLGIWRDKNDETLGYSRFIQYATGTECFEVTLYNKSTNSTLDPNGTTIQSVLQLALEPFGESNLKIAANTLPIGSSYNLGDSSHKWKTFNGINPGSLSFPSGGTTENTDWFDISGAIKPVGGNTTDFTGKRNDYTPPVDGWLALAVNDCSKLSVWCDSLSYGQNSISPNSTEDSLFLMPVIAGKNLDIQIKGTSWYSARLIVPKGNV